MRRSGRDPTAAPAEDPAGVEDIVDRAKVMNVPSMLLVRQRAEVEELSKNPMMKVSPMAKAIPVLANTALLSFFTVSMLGAPTALAAEDKAKAPAPAKAASFEEASEGAEPAGDLAVRFEPLYAACPTAAAAGDVAVRRCARIRDWHAERMQAGRYLVTGDSSSLATQPYDAAEKTLTLTVTGCLHCARPVVLAGGPRIVVTRPPQAIDRGVPVGLDIGFHEIPLVDARAAQRWQARTFPKLRVDYVFSQPAPFAQGAIQGVRVGLLGYRVYNRCTGEVLAADPPSKATSLKGDASCPQEGPTEEELEAQREFEKLPQILSPTDIARALAPTEERVAECASTFELKGTAQVKLVLRGDGSTAEWKILPPFDQGEAYMCIKQALKLAKFPKFKAREMKVDYPFPLGR